MFLDGTDLIFLNNNYLLKMRMKEILGKLSKEVTTQHPYRKLLVNKA